MHPLDATFDRLRAINEYFDVAVVDRCPDGWIALEDVAATDVIATMIEQSTATSEHRDASALAVADAFIAATVRPSAAAFVLDGAGVDVGPASLVGHLDGAHFDRLGVRGATVVASPSARTDCNGAIELDSPQEVADWIAERIVASATVVIDEVRRSHRSGLIGLWGMVADKIADTSLYLARRAGFTQPAQHRAWSDAQMLTDAVARLVPHMRSRPRLFPSIGANGTETLFHVRSTCCLEYKLAHPHVDAGPTSRYCATCPLIDDDSRRARMVT